MSNNEKEILFKSNGWLAMNKIGAFIGMHIIFMQNYKDLMIIISKIQNPQIIFEQRTDLTLNYINKYIFNFISSATALRDNFNELVKKYKNRIKFTQGIKPQITLLLEHDSEIKMLKEVEEFLKQI